MEDIIGNGGESSLNYGWSNIGRTRGLLYRDVLRYTKET